MRVKAPKVARVVAVQPMTSTQIQTATRKLKATWSFDAPDNYVDLFQPRVDIDLEKLDFRNLYRDIVNHNDFSGRMPHRSEIVNFIGEHLNANNCADIYNVLLDSGIIEEVHEN